ncbi:MAG: diaminopimelate decarboxylase, partial [Candidatus Omnitrophota bacterium]
TGKLTNKFGIDFENALRIFSRKSNFTHLRIAGLHLHIGSQITESGPYIAALKKMIKFIDKLKTLDIRLEYLNIGGGMGIVYDKETPQTAAKFAGRIVPLLKSTGLKIIMEPGRFIVGNAGMLVTKVLYVKSTPIKKFVIVDAGMNDLIRPALYDAYHSIAPVEIRKIQAKEKVDVVGPICESGDFLAKERILPRLAPGEYLAIFGTGAYGLSMSSNYNSRRRPAEIMVKGNKTFVIRARESYNDLIRNETVVTT